MSVSEQHLPLCNASGKARPCCPFRGEAAAFAVLLLFALSIRLWQLGSLPDGLFCDEASNGLDAWSLLHTGRSLHGDLLPMFFIQHGKNAIEALYAYMTAPVVGILGLNTMSIRLVPALGGTLLVATAFLAARAAMGRGAGWFTAFLVAVSPWSFVFSRVAFRGILAPMLLMLGVWGFVRMFDRQRFAFVAALGFGLALHTYSVTKAFVPLALLALCVLFWPEMKRLFSERKSVRTIAFAGALFLALAIPVYGFALLGPGNSRFEQLSVFRGERPVTTLLVNFAAHLSPGFLFLSGDANGRHTPPETGGVLLLGTAPLMLLGLGAALWRRDRRALVAPVLFILGILPSAMTKEGIPHALRSIEAAPFAFMMSAGGAMFLMDFFGKLYGAKIAATVAVVVVVVLAANGGWFLQRYFTTYPATSQAWFQYGMGEAIEIAETSPHERVILSGGIHMGYVFPLFYGSADVRSFQAEQSLGGRYVWTAGYGLGQLPEGPAGERWLLIGHPLELPGEPGRMIRGRYDIPYVKLAERAF